MKATSSVSQFRYLKLEQTILYITHYFDIMKAFDTFQPYIIETENPRFNIKNFLP